MTKAPLRYSIVIVTYRRHGPLCDTLKQLGPMIDPADGEAIVIDQCPSTPLPSNVRAIPSVCYITLERPGMVQARNVGLLQARGIVTIFLDDDVVPTPNLIEGHLAAYADPTVGAVAGRILDPTDGPGVPPTPEADNRIEGWRHPRFDHTAPSDVVTARGCNMSF